MEDREIECRDCHKVFVFTAGEQEFYADKGFSAPTRCPECRKLRKQARAKEQANQEGGEQYGRTGNKWGDNQKDAN